MLLAEPGRALDEAIFSLLDEPIFSPDGTQIAYVEEVGEWPQREHKVWMVDADGSGAHVIVDNELTREPGSIVGLEWSPTGDRIAMGLVRDSGSGKYYFDPIGEASVDAGIYTFSPDGSQFTLVIEGGVGPTWSADGSRIAFEGLRRDGDHPSRFMIADADGADRQDLSLPAMGQSLWHPGPYRFAARET